MIPALIRKMIEAAGDEVVLWGDGSPTREFLYVDDCVDGLVARGRAYDGPEPVNLGTGVETSIRETRRARRRSRRLRGRRSRGTRRCPTASRAGASTPPARASSSAGRPGRRFAKGSRRRSRRSARPSREQRARPAAPSRVQQPLAALGRATDTITRHVVIALGTIIVVQIGATIALFFSINTNGWLTYQGGDQIWLVTSGWLLGDGIVGYGLTSHGWPLLLAPLTWITGSSSVQLLPVTTILQVGVLGPIATLAVYDIGARLAGRLAGLWCACAFVAAPFAAIPYFVQRYHDSWVEQFLPQALGLTQQADFPSVVAVLVSCALTVRALQAGAHREAVLAGTFAGVALALKPSNALFLGGPALAFLLARRFGHALLFAVAIVPALVALTLWKAKGLGEVPLFAQDELRLAAGAGDPVVGSVTTWFERTVNLNFETWKQNMSNLREFTWSARVVQWLPLAGALAVARRSLPAAGLLFGWLLGFVLVKGAADVATVESGSYWRLIMPALPAFVLLAAAVPLLVPTLMRRLGARLEPSAGRRPAPPATVAVVGVTAIVPIAVIGLSPQARAAPNPTAPPAFVSQSVVVDDIGVPADADVVRLDVRRSDGGNVLTWSDTTSRARTFYKVYRASARRSPTSSASRAASTAASSARRRSSRPVSSGTSTRRRRPTRPTASGSRRTGSTTRRRATCSRSARLPLRGPRLRSPRPSSSASRRARRSATSCARRTLSSVSRERTVE